MNIEKIKFVQLDPFGYCNAKCWFCPVRYFPQPKEGSVVMPIELVDRILNQLFMEKLSPDGIVDHRCMITFSHYNEILLYKHFDELLALLKIFKFKCFILSNGIPLSKEKVDVISKYKDVVIHVGLNIPAFERELWAKRSGFSADSFDRLIDNLNYAQQKLNYLGSELQIGINGLNNRILNEGYLTTGENFDSENYNLDVNSGEHETQYQLAKKMFPLFNVHKNYLYDRAGMIDHIITNKPYLKKIQKGKKVVACNNGGDRSKEWLNINAAGKVFLCCNDYNFDYEFGDLRVETIKEVWLSQRRKDVVNNAYKEICTNCYSAVLK